MILLQHDRRAFSGVRRSTTSQHPHAWKDRSCGDASPETEVDRQERFDDEVGQVMRNWRLRTRRANGQAHAIIALHDGRAGSGGDLREGDAKPGPSIKAELLAAVPRTDSDPGAFAWLLWHQSGLPVLDNTPAHDRAQSNRWHRPRPGHLGELRQYEQRSESPISYLRSGQRRARRPRDVQIHMMGGDMLEQRLDAPQPLSEAPPCPSSTTAAMASRRP